MKRVSRRQGVEAELNRISAVPECLRTLSFGTKGNIRSDMIRVVF